MSNETKKNCQACVHSFMEPDDLTCGHPNAGHYGLGLYVKNRAKFEHCKDFSEFEQHPLRNPDGTLKSAVPVVRHD